MDFVTKSFRKDETLTSRTLLQYICPHFWASVIVFSNHAQKWGQIYCKSVQPVRGSSFRNDMLQNPYFSRRTYSTLYTHRVAQTSALFLLKLWYYSNFFALYLFLSKKFYLFPHAALFSNANKVSYSLEFGITIGTEIKINSGTDCRYRISSNSVRPWIVSSLE